MTPIFPHLSSHATAYTLGKTPRAVSAFLTTNAHTRATADTLCKPTRVVSAFNFMIWSAASGEVFR